MGLHPDLYFRILRINVGGIYKSTGAERSKERKIKTDPCDFNEGMIIARF